MFIGAQTVRIAGVLNGSLHIGGQIVSITGTVKGNVYVGAQDFSVNGGNIGGSILAGAQNVNIDKDSTVGGSVLVGASAATIDSQVKRNVFAGAASLNIGEHAVIGKDLYYGTGQNEGQANISGKAIITGAVHKAETKVPQKELQTFEGKLPKLTKAIGIVSTLGSYFGALIVGFLYLKLFGKHFNETASLITNSFWKSLGVGFLVAIAFIPGFIILLFTLVGIPVAGLSLFILLIYLYTAKIVVGSSLGNWISKRYNWKMSTYKAFSIGLLVICILRLIPFVGGITGLVVCFAGLGALTLRMFSKIK